MSKGEGSYEENDRAGNNFYSTCCKSLVGDIQHRETRRYATSTWGPGWGNGHHPASERIVIGGNGSKCYRLKYGRILRVSRLSKFPNDWSFVLQGQSRVAVPTCMMRDEAGEAVDSDWGIVGCR